MHEPLEKLIKEITTSFNEKNTAGYSYFIEMLEDLSLETNKSEPTDETLAFNYQKKLLLHALYVATNNFNKAQENIFDYTEARNTLCPVVKLQRFIIVSYIIISEQLSSRYLLMLKNNHYTSYLNALNMLSPSSRYPLSKDKSFLPSPYELFIGRIKTYLEAPSMTVEPPIYPEFLAWNTREKEAFYQELTRLLLAKVASQSSFIFKDEPDGKKLRLNNHYLHFYYDGNKLSQFIEGAPFLSLIRLYPDVVKPFFKKICTLGYRIALQSMLWGNHKFYQDETILPLMINGLIENLEHLRKYTSFIATANFFSILSEMLTECSYVSYDQMKDSLAKSKSEPILCKVKHAALLPVLQGQVSPILILLKSLVNNKEDFLDGTSSASNAYQNLKKLFIYGIIRFCSAHGDGASIIDLLDNKFLDDYINDNFIKEIIAIAYLRCFLKNVSLEYAKNALTYTPNDASAKELIYNKSAFFQELLKPLADTKNIELIYSYAKWFYINDAAPFCSELIDRTITDDESKKQLLDHALTIYQSKSDNLYNKISFFMSKAPNNKEDLFYKLISEKIFSHKSGVPLEPLILPTHDQNYSTYY